MDRASDCGSGGCEFDSHRGHLGGMLEWSNRLVSKTMRFARGTGVQIPLPPPDTSRYLADRYRTVPVALSSNS